MSAPHFFADDVSGDRVILDGDEAHHAVRVLRLRPGEAITVSDGRGTVADAAVVEAGDRLVAHVNGRRAVPAPSPAVQVFQAIPKHGKLDLVVQKLTELGAAEIRLFVAARSVPRWDPSKGAAHAARLSDVARHAAKQSRRAWLPRVFAPAPIDVLDLPVPTLVLHETATIRLGAALPDHAPRTLCIVVGPEGGLTEAEVSGLAARGATPVTLGPSILRTETAALAAASIVLSRYGMLG